MSYMQLIGMGVVSTWRRCENKNHENFFWRAIMHFREILHQRKFPTIRYAYSSLVSRPIPSFSMFDVEKLGMGLGTRLFYLARPIVLIFQLRDPRWLSSYLHVPVQVSPLVILVPSC
jgi:hypothetical protein